MAMVHSEEPSHAPTRLCWQHHMQEPYHQPMVQGWMDHMKRFVITDYPHLLPMSSTDQHVPTPTGDGQPKPTPTDAASRNATSAPHSAPNDADMGACIMVGALPRALTTSENNDKGVQTQCRRLAAIFESVN